MGNNKKTKTEKNNLGTKSEAIYYEIKVQGQLSPMWSEWFEGMMLSSIVDRESGLEYTIIAGLVVDQPALHGLLNKIRDLNLPLISVHRNKGIC